MSNRIERERILLAKIEERDQRITRLKHKNDVLTFCVFSLAIIATIRMMLLGWGI